MKLLTLNTHSLVEKDWEKKLFVVADAIIKEGFDAVALQEVNQPKDSAVIWEESPISIKYPLKNGNYMLKLEEILKDYSHNYKFVWCGFKESYGKFDEGVGIITRLEIEDIKAVELTSGREKNLWKKRYALGIKTPLGDFFSTHMGWWQDDEEPFSEQWERLKNAVGNRKTWIMGDFNAESHKRNQGYDLVTSSGFSDSYVLAKDRDLGYTVCDKIDGWDSGGHRRIDYIFCNFPARIKSCKTMFNGENYDIVSDHFGVAVETEE